MRDRAARLRPPARAGDASLVRRIQHICPRGHPPGVVALPFPGVAATETLPVGAILADES
jgi:hypothetical protein